jgi:hypothetical protein
MSRTWTITKKEGAQSHRTPWQHTYPHGLLIPNVPKLNRDT